MSPMAAAAGSGLAAPTVIRAPGPELGGRRQPGVDVRRPEAQALEPPGGAGEAAASEHLVVAVHHQHGTDGEAQHERRPVKRGRWS